MEKKILDVTAAGRRMWFNKYDGRAEFYNGNFKQLPYDDEIFNLVIFDPPHLKAGKAGCGIMYKKYGALNKETWAADLKKGFDECWRVLRPGGTLIFKWSEAQIKLPQLWDLYPVPPLCGHPTINKTKWICFFKEGE